MFKKTAPNPQLDMFTAPVMQLGSRASKKYSDPQAWHNQFYSLVTTKIDEEIFKPLFPEGKKSGRPNASIRVLVGMSILKEGYGCSDEDLFEKCEFDLLTRKALGLELLTDVTPSIDTYYLFRRRICEYEQNKYSFFWGVSPCFPKPYEFSTKPPHVQKEPPQHQKEPPQHQKEAPYYQNDIQKNGNNGVPERE